MEQEAGGGEEGKQRSSVGGLHVDNDEKMDSLQLEYTYLLTSQVTLGVILKEQKAGFRIRTFLVGSVKFSPDPDPDPIGTLAM